LFSRPLNASFLANFPPGTATDPTLTGAGNRGYNSDPMEAEDQPEFMVGASNRGGFTGPGNVPMLRLEIPAFDRASHVGGSSDVKGSFTVFVWLRVKR